MANPQSHEVGSSEHSGFNVRVIVALVVALVGGGGGGVALASSAHRDAPAVELVRRVEALEVFQARTGERLAGIETDVRWIRSTMEARQHQASDSAR